MVHSTATRAGLITAGALLALGLAGCQNGGPGSQAGAPQPTASESSAPEPSASDGDGGTPSGNGPGPVRTAPASSGGRCTASDLRLSLGGGDAAAGTSYRTLVFTNVSGHSCTVQGFPGVSYVTGDNGAQVGAPAARTGSGGTTIRLANGQTASSSVGFVNVGNYDEAECRPADTRGIRVYPPGETRSKFVALQGKGCANDKVQQLNVAALQRGSGR
ncbi:MAG TPA: DUF4232 domain-containing protein [Actinomadura sp.]|nr:DUF4232 domain-containing protein [Actinomadura sp.]